MKVKVEYTDPAGVSETRLLPKQSLIDWENLEASIRKLFLINPDHRIAIKYQDEEGDFITIGETRELQDALAVAESCNKQSLKLFVSLNNRQDLAKEPAAVHRPDIASSEPSIVVEVSCNDSKEVEVIDFAVGRGLHALFEEIGKLFLGKVSSCKYVDEDNDQVTMTEEEEFAEAIRVVNTAGLPTLRLIASVRVPDTSEPASEEVSDAPSPALAKEPSAEWANLSYAEVTDRANELYRMGFKDSALNIKLLHQYHGDVSRCIDDLRKRRGL